MEDSKIPSFVIKLYFVVIMVRLSKTICRDVVIRMYILFLRFSALHFLICEFHYSYWWNVVCPSHWRTHFIKLKYHWQFFQLIPKAKSRLFRKSKTLIYKKNKCNDLLRINSIHESIKTYTKIIKKNQLRPKRFH